jgi:hypothetical protein
LGPRRWRKLSKSITFVSKARAEASEFLALVWGIDGTSYPKTRCRNTLRDRLIRMGRKPNQNKFRLKTDAPEPDGVFTAKNDIRERYCFRKLIIHKMLRLSCDRIDSATTVNLATDPGVAAQDEFYQSDALTGPLAAFKLPAPRWEPKLRGDSRRHGKRSIRPPDCLV